MGNIQQIIQKIKAKTTCFTGEKTIHHDNDYFINRWKLTYEKNHFVYEHIYYINHKKKAVLGAEQETFVKLILTEKELIELFNQQESRYFFNGKVIHL